MPHRWDGSWEVEYWRQPLDAWCDEFTGSGFLIERVHEPRPSARLRERDAPVADELAVTPGFIVFSLLRAPLKAPSPDAPART